MKFAISLSAIGALAIVAPLVAQSPTPLSSLMAEAAKSNPDILAAEDSSRAAAHVKEQMTTLPNPALTIQQFSVGSPKPFAGFSNSNFAYIGIGASQEIPYPGKSRLKGDVADRTAMVQEAQVAVKRASVADQLKSDYLRLAYLQQTFTLLEESKTVLRQVTESELLRYRTGSGNQSDVLKAELQKTKLVREITMHHQEMGSIQADLKRLLYRPQQSPDIIAENITETALRYDSQHLLDLVKAENPDVHVAARAIDKSNAELQSSKRGAKPDFSVGYMYQRTGTDFPAYYMLSFSVIPQRRQRVHAEVEQATELLKAAKHELAAQIQQQMAEVQKQYVATTSTADQLAEYREGIIPQADAVFHAVLVGYESNKQQLGTVLTSLNEVFELKRDYAEVLLDHEMALARLETLTGATLR